MKGKLAGSHVMWRTWVTAITRVPPGIDGVTIADIEVGGVESARAFLDELGRSASSRSYGPKSLWRVNIRKPGKAGEIRTLGIPTIADRVIMTAAEIVVEPIFEADFHPVSFGSRPKRSAHDEPRPVPTREHHNVQRPPPALPTRARRRDHLSSEVGTTRGDGGRSPVSRCRWRRWDTGRAASPFLHHPQPASVRGELDGVRRAAPWADIADSMTVRSPREVRDESEPEELVDAAVGARGGEHRSPSSWVASIILPGHD